MPANAVTVAPIETRIQVQTDQFTSALNTAVKQSNTFGSNVQKNTASAGTSFRGLVSAISPVNLGIAGLSTAVIAFGKHAVASSMAAEHAVSELNTILKLPRYEIDNLSEGITDISKKFGIDFVQATKAAYQAASAGVPKDNIISFLESSSTLAIGGVADLTEVVNVLAGTINAYGLDMADAASVSDTMFKTVEMGVINMSQLASSFGRATGTAASFGIKLDELAAMYVATTKAGLTAELATTRITALMTALSREDTIKKAEKYGVTLGISAIKAEGLTKVLENLRRATGGSSEKLKEIIPDTEAYGAAVLLAGENTTNWNQALEAMKDKAGAAEEALGRMNDTTLTWNKLTENIAAKQREVGDSIKEVIVGTVAGWDTILSRYDLGNEKEKDHIALIKDRWKAQDEANRKLDDEIALLRKQREALEGLSTKKASPQLSEEEKKATKETQEARQKAAEGIANFEIEEARRAYHEKKRLMSTEQTEVINTYNEITKGLEADINERDSITKQFFDNEIERLDELKKTEEDYRNSKIAAFEEENRAILMLADTYAIQFETTENGLQNIVDTGRIAADTIWDIFTTLEASTANIINTMLWSGGSVRDMWKDVAKQVTGSIIRMGTQLAAQWVLMTLLGVTQTQMRSQAEIGASAGAGYAGAYAQALAVLPFPYGAAIAPLYAKAASSALLTGSISAGAAGASAGKTIGSFAEGGRIGGPFGSQSGDAVMVQAHKDEVILNPKEQAVIRDLLGGIDGKGGNISINIASIPSEASVSKRTLERWLMEIMEEGGPVPEKIRRMSARQSTGFRRG